MSSRGRRLLTALLAVILGAGAALLVLIFFNARDDATFSTAAGPGQALPDQGARHITPSQRRGVKYATDPPASGPHVPVLLARDRGRISNDQLLHALELGDVVVFYPESRPPRALVTLQRQLSGPFDPVLAGAGQQVVLARRPATKGVLALAWARRLDVPAAGDPRLRPFTDFWLGRGAKR